MGSRLLPAAPGMPEELWDTLNTLYKLGTLPVAQQGAVTALTTQSSSRDLWMPLGQHAHHSLMLQSLLRLGKVFRSDLTLVF